MNKYYQNSTQASKPVQKPPRPAKVKFQSGGTVFIVDDRYQYIKQIGHGAYGVVCSAYDKKINKKVAIKKVTNAFQDLIDGKRILRQIRLLKFFRHNHIISLVDLQLPEDKRGYQDYYIVTELMETDLHRVIYSKQDLTEEHIQYFIYQILKGLNYMHSANVMHRDLKPSNILCNKDCVLKICDLGLARGFEDQDQNKTEYVVTRWYRAPQIILKASEYDKAIDVWSVGCIFAELLGRTPLFPGKDYLEQIQRIISILGTPSYQDQKFITNDAALKYIKGLPKRSKQNWKNLFPNCSSQGLNLLQKMLAFNPNKRISVSECLAHPYFEQMDPIEESDTCDQIFDWSGDNFELKKQTLQQMMYNQAVTFKNSKNLK